ncbi:GNAT family N-acetyltransferase [Agromyces sp. NPDC058110]|uniref:GNAT family N-acetyltransferase n=1 Tax=Agromyces sp. NPDC058110 TaxID=3346345 RepID=UPI0036DA29FC
MPATSPADAPLHGRFVTLAPLTADDLPELARALRHPEVFAGGYGGGPAGLPRDDAAFVAWAERYYAVSGGAISWGVRLASGPGAGTLVGATKLADVELGNEAIHIGWTAYDPRVWSTPVNVETKLLLLGLAFDHGFGRVKLQADALNGRSRAAILKLGAQFEGVLRRRVPRADGSWRDTAMYSVIVDEWPAVRDGLQSRRDAWGDAPIGLSPRA